jgi:serine O-acetyltransferase
MSSAPKQPDLPDDVSRKLRAALRRLVKRSEKSSTFLPIGEYSLPQPEAAAHITALLRQILFFGYIGRQDLTAQTLEAHLAELSQQFFHILSDQIARALRHSCHQEHRPCDKCRGNGERQALALIHKLADIREILEDDVRAAYDGDPAAKSYDEIVFSYPGLYAITVHRVAHELYIQEVPLLPRLLSELAHSQTGIDIHPGAKIGRSFFIDHGTGVVIGETTVIGDHVKMYQGATLGALSFPRDACGALIRGAKRHPTIEDHVTIYAGAAILGGDVVIGRGSVIGSSVWLTHSVPPGTKVITESPRLQYKNSEHALKDESAPDFQI